MLKIISYITKNNNNNNSLREYARKNIDRTEILGE